MDLKSVLLGFLRRGDCTGYELKAAMEESVGFFFGASYGSIYPALKVLESGGMVRVREVVQSGKPNKKIYKITPEGEAYFRAQLRERPAEDGFRSEFLMQLFFGQHQDSDRLLALLSEHRASREAKLGLLRGVEATVKDVADPYEMMCLRYGLTSYEATLSWLDETEAQVRELAKKRKQEVENEAS
ncbi:MAG: PadR family transcriptional regulator [Rubrobacteraceae bacterium]